MVFDVDRDAVARHQRRLHTDMADVKTVGIRSTPTFFINDKLLAEFGLESLRDLAQNIEIAQARNYFAGALMHSLENRIPPPLVAILFGALMWGASLCVPGIEVADTLRIATALLILLGSISICLAGVASFRRARTTVNPLKPHMASSLVSRGIYRYTRNPMYLGFAGALAAWAVLLAAPITLLGVLGFVLYMNRFQIEPEERALTALFGTEFTDYQSRVRKWI